MVDNGWEYFFLDGLLSGKQGVQLKADLAELGKQGWELIAVIGPRHHSQELVLKRPLRT